VPALLEEHDRQAWTRAGRRELFAAGLAALGPEVLPLLDGDEHAKLRAAVRARIESR
jgi:hypothetical protein